MATTAKVRLKPYAATGTISLNQVAASLGVSVDFITLNTVAHGSANTSKAYLAYLSQENGPAGIMPKGLIYWCAVEIPKAAMVVSRKVASQFVTAILLWGVAYLVSKTGLHLDAATSEMISSVVGIASGAIAGWITKEVPNL